MKKQLKNRLAIALFALAAVSSIQGQGRNSLTVEIPFEFTAGKKALPAGTYQLTREGPGPSLSIRKVNGTDRINLPVLTRLARNSSSDHDVRVVFDKANDVRFLSEVWLPGEDGLLLRASSKEHTHEVLGAKPK